MIPNSVPSSTIFEVENLKLVRPDGAGQFWKGVPHSQLIRNVANALDRAHLRPRLTKGKFVLSRGDADLIATIPVDGFYGMYEIHPHISFVASNACRKALEFYVGAMIGETPLVVYQFGGIVKFPSWEYIGGFKLEDVCDEAVSYWKLNVPLILERYEELQAEDQMDVSSLLFNAADRKMTTFNSLKRIWESYKLMKGTTGFDLLTAFSQHFQPERTMYRLEVLRNFAELVVPLNKRIAA